MGSSRIIFSIVCMLFSDRDSNEIFAPSAQLRHGLGIAAGRMGGNPSGLFLVPIIRVDRIWIRGNCFSVPLQFFEKICVGALTPSSRSSFGDEYSSYDSHLEGVGSQRSPVFTDTTRIQLTIQVLIFGSSEQ